MPNSNESVYDQHPSKWVRLDHLDADGVTTLYLACCEGCRWIAPHYYASEADAAAAIVDHHLIAFEAAEAADGYGTTNQPGGWGGDR